MFTILALQTFSNHLRDVALNKEPIHSYILGPTRYTWDVNNFQLVNKHVAEQDETRKKAGLPYWLVFLCSREKIAVSKIQERHFGKVWSTSGTAADASRYDVRMGNVDFKFNIYSNSIKVIEDVEELILTVHVDQILELTVPGLFEDPTKPYSVNIADFKVDALQKVPSPKGGVIVYLQCSGNMDYPVITSRETKPLILTEVLTINFVASFE